MKKVYDPGYTRDRYDRTFAVLDSMSDSDEKLYALDLFMLKEEETAGVVFYSYIAVGYYFRHGGSQYMHKYCAFYIHRDNVHSPMPFTDGAIDMNRRKDENSLLTTLNNVLRRYKEVLEFKVGKPTRTYRKKCE